MVSEAGGSLPLWLSMVRRFIAPLKPDKLSCLDLCCNEMTGVRQLRFASVTGVDVADWKTRWPGARFILGDAVEVACTTPAASYDVVLCSDGIEHLAKARGWELLLEMERVARHVSIVFTPLGDHIVEPGATHPDKHRSGWLPAEFEARGWHTASYPCWHGAFGAFFAWRCREAL